MKRKELKNLAEKLAKLELTLRATNDEKVIAKTKNEIMRLSNSVTTMEDLLYLDELVMKILAKNS